MTQKNSKGSESEGWESFAEEADGGSLSSNPELEAALREAAEAVESEPSESQPSEGEVLELTDPIIEESIEDSSAEIVELKDSLLRLRAEFDNFRKRALKERQEAQRYGHQNLAKDLLTAVDNLDRALDHSRASEGGDLKSLLRGVELVQRELVGALGNHGVTRVEALGKTFDPSLHEAMAQAPDGSVPENTVIEVFEQGYQLRDRLIRPARVVVAKAPEEEDEKAPEEEDIDGEQTSD